MRYLATLFLCATGLFGVQSVSAQWTSDTTKNTLVASALYAQEHASAVSDGKDGVFIVWEDYRGGQWDIYAQHLDANGKRLWGDAGLAICDTVGYQRYPRVAADNAGGCWVVWEDSRASGNKGIDIYGQRIKSDGTRAWAKMGLPVCDTTRDQTNAQIVADGFGFAYVAWEDDRRFGTTYRPDINLNKLSADTVLWGRYGKVLLNSNNAQKNPRLAADGVGGVVITFENALGVPQSIYAARTSSSGEIWIEFIGALKLRNINALVFNTGSLQGNIETLIGRDGTSLTSDVQGWKVNATGGTYTITYGTQTTQPIQWNANCAAVVSALEALNNIGNGDCGCHTNFGNVIWGFNKQGYEVYQGPNFNNLCYNPTIVRDGNEFWVLWEQASVSAANGRDLYANKIRMDTTKLYDPAAEITGSWVGDQIHAQIFPDDSGGALIVFEDNSGGDLPPTFYQQDIAVVRLMPNGVETRPALGSGFFYAARQTRGQTWPQAVKSDDGVIIVWNDARNAALDSSVYAQKVDRRLKRYFPAPGTSSSWGQAIASSSISKARQVILVPRTNGAIAVWSDDRSGNYDLYAQVIFKDGTLPVELAGFSVAPAGPGRVQLKWQTASELDNAGFEVERRKLGTVENTYQTVASFRYDASLRGRPHSNTLREYRFMDAHLDEGIYEYRLVDYSLDGTRTEHNPKSINLSASIAGEEWSITQNSPNPFSDYSRVTFNLQRAARTEMTLVDVTGRAFVVPSGTGYWSAGQNQATINAKELGLPCGAYMLRLQAFDEATGDVVWTTNKGVLLQVIR